MKNKLLSNMKDTKLTSYSCSLIHYLLQWQLIGIKRLRKRCKDTINMLSSIQGCLSSCYWAASMQSPSILLSTSSITSCLHSPVDLPKQSPSKFSFKADIEESLAWRGSSEDVIRNTKLNRNLLLLSCGNCERTGSPAGSILECCEGHRKLSWQSWKEKCVKAENTRTFHHTQIVSFHSRSHVPCGAISFDRITHLGWESETGRPKVTVDMTVSLIHHILRINVHVDHFTMSHDPWSAIWSIQFCDPIPLTTKAQLNLPWWLILEWPNHFRPVSCSKQGMASNMESTLSCNDLTCKGGLN